MAYANVACTECNTPYWHGPTESIEDEPDFDNTVGEVCCPNCKSTNRRPWPNLRLSIVYSIRGPEEEGKQ